ncbi:aminotransferase [Sparassis latifolia]|uniref:Aminodeoxychorismate lyase n=1 Tax=Sparassis crispa TaxID=139825 RepID=A0A401G5L2_9APHY|nr:Aminodeoxychorismate lyase [Sparassis crispa]GBE77444.1 Aminodeoxychorismate lyase [Sparassis crispa]
MSPDFDLLSSIRYDHSLRDLQWNTLANGGIQSPYLLLRYHLDRLLDAAEQHGWQFLRFITHDSLKIACDDAVRDASSDLAVPSSTFKIRIIVTRAGVLKASAAPVPPLPSLDPGCASLEAVIHDPLPSIFEPLLTICLDTEPTPSSVFTRTKTTHRPHYSAARNRLGVPPLPSPSTKDVLLYNPSGELTETSIRNIAFLRGSPARWVTPHSSTGCLCGVMRRWLLEQGRIVEASEGELRLGNLVDGEYVLTFNGVEGCRLGRINMV